MQNKLPNINVQMLTDIENQCFKETQTKVIYFDKLSNHFQLKKFQTIKNRMNMLQGYKMLQNVRILFF